MDYDRPAVETAIRAALEMFAEDLDVDAAVAHGCREYVKVVESKREAILDRAMTMTHLPTPARRKELRIKAGLSQHDVADALGLSAKSIMRFEDGKRDTFSAEFYTYVLFLEELADVIAYADKD